MTKRRFFVQGETMCERCNGQCVIKDPTGLWAKIDAVRGLRSDERELDKFLRANRDAGSFSLANPPAVEVTCAACNGKGWLPDGQRVDLVDALRALGVQVTHD